MIFAIWHAAQKLLILSQVRVGLRIVEARHLVVMINVRGYGFDKCVGECEKQL